MCTYVELCMHPFLQPHFISFMNDIHKSTPGSNSGGSCITRICNYSGHTCMVQVMKWYPNEVYVSKVDDPLLSVVFSCLQFTDAKTAKDVLKHHPIIYDRRELSLELSDQLLPDGSAFVSFENLSTPFHEVQYNYSSHF